MSGKEDKVVTVLGDLVTETYTKETTCPSCPNCGVEVTGPTLPLWHHHHAMVVCLSRIRDDIEARVDPGRVNLNLPLRIIQEKIDQHTKERDKLCPTTVTKTDQGTR